MIEGGGRSWRPALQPAGGGRGRHRQTHNRAGAAPLHSTGPINLRLLLFRGRREWAHARAGAGDEHKSWHGGCIISVRAAGCTAKHPQLARGLHPTCALPQTLGIPTKTGLAPGERERGAVGAQGPSKPAAACVCGESSPRKHPAQARAQCQRRRFCCFLQGSQSFNSRRGEYLSPRTGESQDQQAQGSPHRSRSDLFLAGARVCWRRENA